MGDYKKDKITSIDITLVLEVQVTGS